MLLFLNDVPEGGQLKFEKLGNLQFSPRAGDAVAWSNVNQEDGTVDVSVIINNNNEAKTSSELESSCSSCI